MPSSKSDFILRVFMKYGFIPVFDGDPPLINVPSEVEGENFSSWCERVLARKTKEVKIYKLTTQNGHIKVSKLGRYRREVQSLLKAKEHRVRNRIERRVLNKNCASNDDCITADLIQASIQVALEDHSDSTMEFFERFSNEHAGNGSWKYMFEEMVSNYSKLISLIKEKDEFVFSFDEEPMLVDKSLQGFSSESTLDETDDDLFDELNHILPKLIKEINDFTDALPVGCDITSKFDFSDENVEIQDHELSVRRNLCALDRVRGMNEIMESFSSIENMDQVINIDAFLEGIDELNTEVENLFDEINTLATEVDFQRTDYISQFESLFYLVENIITEIQDCELLDELKEEENEHYALLLETLSRLSEKARTYYDDVIVTLLEG